MNGFVGGPFPETRNRVPGVKLRRFLNLSVHNLKSRPQRTLLTAIGIVLGVGIVFGVLTLSASMSGAFTALSTKVYGSADLTVTAAGGNGPFDGRVASKISETPGVTSAAPHLAVPASLLIGDNPLEAPEVRSLKVFGVDPESAALATGFELAEGRFPEKGAEMTLDEGAAESTRLGVGDEVVVGTQEGPAKLTVVGTLRVPGVSFGGAALGVMKLPYAQKLFDRPGDISAVSVEAENEGAVAALEERLTRELGERLRVEQPSTRTSQANAQFQSFNVALLFFAGTALFVGAFLVFNALSMTVLERTRELGMFRALGSTRAMISFSVIAEAVVLGVLGSVLGVLLGYGMAQALSYVFGRALRLGAGAVVFSPSALAQAAAVGILVTVLAALYPALRAGAVSPVEAMRTSTSNRSAGQARAAHGLPLLGLLLAGAGALLIYHTATNLSTDLDGLTYALGTAGVLGTFLGVSLVTPALVKPLVSALSPVLSYLFGVEGKMAAANATRNPGRTALTASALMVGISLVVAFSALGGSVLGSIGTYLEDSLGSDFVVQPANADYDVVFSRDLEKEIEVIPGVESTTGVAASLRREDGGMTLVLGVDGSYPEIFPLDYGEGSPPDAFSRLQSGGALIGRQLAESRGLGAGSTVELDSPNGPKSYEVAGVVENDLFGGGTSIYLSKGVLSRDFDVGSDHLLAIKAAPGSDREAIAERVEGVLKGYPQLALYSNAEWKEQVEGEFDRQYVFFYAIMGVAVAVSAFGVVNTLSMNVLERRREIGVLRAVGATRLQVGRLILNEGVVISLIGCALGIALGSLLGYLFVRGSSAAGFEVVFYYPTVPALIALLSGLLIGIFAGLLPARSAARANIVEAVQYE